MKFLVERTSDYYDDGKTKPCNDDRLYYEDDIVLEKDGLEVGKVNGWLIELNTLEELIDFLKVHNRSSDLDYGGIVLQSEGVIVRNYSIHKYEFDNIYRIEIYDNWRE